MEAFAAWAEASALGHAARASGWVYPVANLFHLLGLVLLVGSIGLVDLRLLGGLRALPLRPLQRTLVPIAIGGLALQVVSGTVLFFADATALVRSPLLQAKLLLIVVALANALAFEWLWREREPVPAGLKVMALCSIVAWLTVATLGRLIAYR